MQTELKNIKLFTEHTPQLIKPLSRRSGMSLVEIMIVIAILGTLMTVVAINVMGSKDEADVDATKIQMTKIMEQLTIYAARHKGKYPTTSEGLEAVKDKFGGSVPGDPWGNPYQYYSPSGSGGAFEIISLGKDGKEGGEGVDADIKSSEIGR